MKLKMNKNKTISNNKAGQIEQSQSEVSFKMVNIGIIFSISSAALLIYVFSEKIFHIS